MKRYCTELPCLLLHAGPLCFSIHHLLPVILHVTYSQGQLPNFSAAASCESHTSKNLKFMSVYVLSILFDVLQLQLLMLNGQCLTLPTIVMPYLARPWQTPSCLPQVSFVSRKRKRYAIKYNTALELPFLCYRPNGSS